MYLICTSLGMLLAGTFLGGGKQDALPGMVVTTTHANVREYKANKC